MSDTRREFLVKAGAAFTITALPGLSATRAEDAGKKRHIVTLSFDDGFKKSFVRIAEIYEKHKLSACLNVIATGHRKDFQSPGPYIGRSPRGDFGLWNELKARGHEIMPHTYRHANLRQMPFEKGTDLIRRCLDVFTAKLKGFESKQAVYNFAYNASTPALEKWLAGKVRAFRTGGAAINLWPHPKRMKLTCRGFGPGNCEHAIDREIEKLLARETGWLIFNTHGLDEEGWGPIRASYLDRLLDRLTAVGSVAVLPAGAALVKYADPKRHDSTS
jgi:peptidoglycan/xylan/chitin deacetylase (PgdA/CDA1 family)